MRSDLAAPDRAAHDRAAAPERAPDRASSDAAPDRGQPELAPKPDLPEPDLAKPDLPKPDLPKLDLPKPKPDLPKPDLPKPDLVKPDLAPKPDLPKPDLSCPALTVAPELARAGIPAGGYTPYLAPFAWKPVASATGYELVVYPTENCSGAGVSFPSGAPALEVTLTSTAGGLQPRSFRLQATTAPCPAGPFGPCTPVVVGNGVGPCRVVTVPACTILPAPTANPIAGGCRLAYPPAASQPCPIPTPGTKFYLSPSGADSADGKSPATAWQTLCHALATVPAGSSLLVAKGEYLSSVAILDKAVTVKGGYSADFASWDPDANQTTFHGQLLLNHPGATWGGFRMITRHSCSSCSFTQHKVYAGTVVRNYFEAVTSGANYFTLIELSPCEGDAIRFRCNDVYLQQSGIYAGAIAMTGAGLTLVDANRICAKGVGALAFFDGSPTVAGTSTVRRVIMNSFSESDRYDIFLCADGRETEYVLANNTLFPASVYGKSYCSGLVRYRLLNNVIGAGSWNLDEQSSGKAQIVEARNNLSLSALSLTPAPLAASDNSLGGGYTPAQVFKSPTTGDFKPLAGGPALGQALNLYGLAPYGWPTMDLAQWPRTPSGSWSRGALEP